MKVLYKKKLISSAPNLQINIKFNVKYNWHSLTLSNIKPFTYQTYISFKEFYYVELQKLCFFLS